MGQILNRRRVMGGGGGKLPSGYTQVKGIFANRNTCYINTGLFIDQNCEIYIKFKVKAHSYGMKLFGSYPVVSAQWNFHYSSNHDDFFLSGNFVAKTRCSYDTVHELLLTKDGLVIDGNTTPVAVTDGVSSFSFLVGAVQDKWGTPTAYDNITIYDVIVDGIRFIPCRRDSDNKYGMFNTTTQEFLSSAGSNEFIEGT